MTATQLTLDDCDPTWTNEPGEQPPTPADLRGQGLPRYARITDIPLAEDYL